MSRDPANRSTTVSAVKDERSAALDVAELRAENRCLGYDLDDLRLENRRMRAALAEMQGEILRLSRALEPMHRLNVSQMQRTARSLEVLLYHERARINTLEDQLAGAQMEASSMIARAESHAASVRVQAEADVVRAQRAEAEVQRVQAVLESIYQSTTWRVMTYLSAVLTRHPVVRKLLRNGLFATYRALRRIRRVGHMPR